MEIEGAGKEGAHGSTDDSAANEEGAGADETAARRPPRLPPQKPARGRAIALTTLRPQERQALRRPPIPLLLLRGRAPGSPSPAPT